MMSVKKVTITITVTPPDMIGGLMTKMLASMVVREDISCEDMDFLSALAINLVREVNKDREQHKIDKR